MTTFGGHSLPFVFGGGGDAVFIRDMGAVYEHFDFPNDSPITALDIPVNRKAGDLMQVWTVAQTGAPTESGGPNYVQNFTGVGGFTRGFSRIATNDANDDFSTVAKTGGTGEGAILAAFCMVLASRDPTKTVQLLELSLNRASGGGGNFVRAELQLPSQNQVLSIATLSGRKNLGTGVHSLTPPDLNLFNKGYGYNTGIFRSYWTYIGFVYQDIAAIVPETEVAHLPNQTLISFQSQWATFNAV